MVWARIFIIVLLGVALAGPRASAQLLAPRDSSQVAATATVERLVPPDRAILFIEVTGSGPSPDLATRDMTVARDGVIGALQSAGVPRESVSPWAFAAGESGGAPGGRMPPSSSGAAAEAKMGIRVVTSPDRVEAIAAVALAAGTSVPLVLYEATEAEELRPAMLQEAVRRARADAEAMAEAAGGRLGRLVQLLTTPDYGALASQERLMQVGYRGQGVVITPTNVLLRVTVQGSWLVTYR